MASKLEIDGLEEIVTKYQGKELGDVELPRNLASAKASVDSGEKLRLHDVTFSVEAAGGTSVLLINSGDDFTSGDGDDAGVIGISSEEDDELGLQPQIPFSPDHAWIKYQVEAGVKAGAGGSLSALGFDVRGAKNVILSDYHFHEDRESALSEALVKDVGKIRFAVREGDITQIGPNEALVYRVQGLLGASVEASWGSVFTANLNGLSHLLRANELLVLKTSLGASAKFKVSLSDDFLLVFSRAEKKQIRLAVKKAKESRVGLDASLGVTVELQNPEVLDRLVRDALEALLGTTVDRVERVVEKLAEVESVQALSEADNELIDGLLARFGLDDSNKQPQFLRARWDDLKAFVGNKVVERAKTKIEAAFKYEYLRIKTDSTVLQAVLPDAGVQDQHEALIKRDLDKVIAWMRAHPKDITLEKFLHERKLETESSWSLTVGVGKWKFGGGRVSRSEEIVQHNFDGHERISYLNSDGYKATMWGDTYEYMVDLTAQMEEFSTSRRATADELDFGMTLKWCWGEKELEQKELDKYLDHAIIWQVVDDDDASDIHEAVEEHLDKKAEVSVEIRFDHETLAQLLPRLQAGTLDSVARALAKAVPRWDRFDARTIIERRTRLYTPVWKFYLDNPQLSPKEYAFHAERILRMQKAKKMANMEGLEIVPRPSPFTFGEIIRLNGARGPTDYSDIRRAWSRFHEGAKLLLDARNHRWGHEKVQEAFKSMDELSFIPIHVRSLGAYVMDAASFEPSLLGKVERTLSIEFPEEKLQFTFGTSQRAD